MHPAEDIPNILQALYAGTLDDDAWHRAIIRTADIVGASGGHLLSMDSSTGRVLRDETYRIDPDVGTAYRRHWSTKDILLAPTVKLAVGEPTPDQKLAPLQAWQKSELFNELALPFDLPHVLVTLLHKAPEKIVAISLKRSLRHGPYHEHEAQRLKIIIPHMRRALEIKDRLAHSQVAANNLARSLDNLSFGVLILDASGRIIEASTAAQTLMQRPESGIHVKSGTVQLREPAGTALYRWIIAGRPPADNTDGLLKVPRPGAQTISILVTPLPHKTQSWIAGDPRWMLLLFDSERRIHPCTGLIARDLGISAREAEIAALLVAGYDLKTIAQRLAISPNTVRTHLKTIFSKTGICSQAELVRRIANGPAMIG
jgi:DNA-binding CsgD family transcriptional regulator